MSYTPIVRYMVVWSLIGESWRNMVLYCYFVLDMSPREIKDYLGLDVRRTAITGVITRIRDARGVNGISQPKIRKLIKYSFKHVMDLKPVVYQDRCFLCGRKTSRKNRLSYTHFVAMGHLIHAHKGYVEMVLDQVMKNIAYEIRNNNGLSG